MIAKSLSSSSEFGALSHSARLASGNSFPITGVTSNDLNWSRKPVDFNGVLIGTEWGFSVRPLDTAPFVADSSALPLKVTFLWTWSATGGAASTVEEAMSVFLIEDKETVLCRRYHNQGRLEMKIYRE